MDSFDGGRAKFRGWMFDFAVCIGQIDKGLSDKIRMLMASNKSRDDKWDPKHDGDVDQELYQKYSGELYGVLCGLTSGEPKNLVRGIVKGGFGQDGHKALVILNKRYDTRNGATLLHAFLEIVNPPAWKSGELVSGIHKWETRMAVLKSRYGEDLTPSVKLAVLVGINQGVSRYDNATYGGQGWGANGL
jgi:hypothetical protein